MRDQEVTRGLEGRRPRSVVGKVYAFHLIGGRTKKIETSTLMNEDDSYGV